MAAVALPLELQQHIFSYLDNCSFDAVRKVCRYWRWACVEPSTLRRQLRQFHIRPDIHGSDIDLCELHALFNEASRKQLADVHVRPQQAIGCRPPQVKYTVGCLGRPQIPATSSGHWTVTINDQTVALFDQCDEAPKMLAQRPLEDKHKPAGGGAQYRVSPANTHELALSSDGRILAVAKDRQIQIYDLHSQSNSETVHKTIKHAPGCSITGLGFEQDNYLLRVCLSERGSVLYLGSPRSSRDSSSLADLNHWRSPSGLQNVCMDSALLTFAPHSTSPEYWARMTGPQLLQQLGDGWLFASQKHGGGERSHYILGYIVCSSPESLPGPHLTIQSLSPRSVVQLARLETGLSVADFESSRDTEVPALERWKCLPSAHEHHPQYALDIGCGLLALAEHDKKDMRHFPQTQVFLYRVPNAKRIADIITKRQEEACKRWSMLDDFLHGGMSERRECKKAVKLGPCSRRQRPRVARMPLCLGTVRGEVKGVEFTSEDGIATGQYMLTVKTAEAERRWSLRAT